MNPVREAFTMGCLKEICYVKHQDIEPTGSHLSIFKHLPKLTSSEQHERISRSGFHPSQPRLSGPSYSHPHTALQTHIHACPWGQACCLQDPCPYAHSPSCLQGLSPRFHSGTLPFTCQNLLSISLQEVPLGLHLYPLLAQDSKVIFLFSFCYQELNQGLHSGLIF